MIDKINNAMVICIVCGDMEENAYIYADETTHDAFVIDPGAEPEKLTQAITDNDLTVRGILLTHGHFDHIGAAKALAEEYDVPIYAFDNSEYLSNPSMNLSVMLGEPTVIEDYTPVSDGTVLRLSASSPFTLRVIASPGHTTDSVLFYDEVNELCFTGDTIFKGTYGNYMLPGGDRATLFATLRHIVLTLPENTRLYSGHTDMTSVGAEKRYYV